MRKILKHISLVALFFISFAPLSKAQFEVGFFGGLTNYQGDLADGSLIWKETQPAFGALIRYTPNRFLTLRGNFIQGKLTGSDFNSSDIQARSRGFTFKSTIREMSILAEYNILGQSGEHSYDGIGVLFNPYVFAGIGIASTDGVPVAPEDTRPYPFPEDKARSVLPAFPFGGGVKVQFGESVSVGVEWGTRLTFSDYLDGVSKTGNPKRNDWYMFGGLTLTYCFGNDY